MKKMKTVGYSIRALPGTPEQCCKKAVQQVKMFHQGAHNFTRIDDRGCGYFKINLGPFWRLLSRNAGRSWDLISHERYNTAIRK